ncbi:MAG: tetratricopeptide repeat protein [Candidatus Hydrogenedentales bacterium]|jgi:hypothetical protein
MDRAEAERQFAKASDLYLSGEYDDALEILTAVDDAFPNNHRVIKAKAQTLAKLGLYRDAIELCDRLLNEFGYEKARPFRERLIAATQEGGVEDEDGVPVCKAELVDDDEPSGPSGSKDSDAATPASGKSRFRIKPVRLFALVALVVGMYFGYVPYWLGGGLIVAYFAVKYAIRAAIYRLFSLPFKMKGKALAGATVELHGHAWTEAPAKGAGNDDDDKEQVKSKPAQPMRFAWIDVTITPPVRTTGFTHWEPGELMIASAHTKIRGLDDMEKCHRIHAVKFLVDGQEQDDEGYKVGGPQRIKVLAELPMGEAEFKFVYYGEVFGAIALSE